MTAQSNPGDYYARKAEEGRKLERQLQDAKERNDGDEVRRLNNLLNLTRYTGD